MRQDFHRAYGEFVPCAPAAGTSVDRVPLALVLEDQDPTLVLQAV